MKGKNAEISVRVGKILSLLHTNANKFANSLGYNRAQTVYDILDGKSAPSYDFFRRLAISEYSAIIDLRWLLTGIGEPLTERGQLNSENRPTEIQTASYTTAPNEGIPLIPVSAMAGIFTGDTSVMEYDCERYVIPDFKGADFLIRVKGDSMQPTYYPGDIVACQRVPLNDLFFQWNKTYVLDTVQGPLIKRINRGSDDSHVLVVSDNTDYEPFELSKDQFHGVALVCGLVRLE